MVGFIQSGRFSGPAPPSDALTLISQVTASGGTTGASFTSIPSTYRDLIVTIYGRGASPGPMTMVLRFNGDSGANYDYLEWRFAAAGGLGASESLGASSINAGYISGSSAPSDAADSLECRIFDYKGSTFQKAVISKNTNKRANTSANIFRDQFSGWWRNTAAITQVDVNLSTGGFVDGSLISLWGRS